MNEPAYGQSVPLFWDQCWRFGVSHAYEFGALCYESQLCGQMPGWNLLPLTPLQAIKLICTSSLRRASFLWLKNTHFLICL